MVPHDPTRDPATHPSGRTAKHGPEVAQRQPDAATEGGGYPKNSVLATLDYEHNSARSADAPPASKAPEAFWAEPRRDPWQA